MTNLRDEIALVVNGYGDGLPDDVALEAADAILAKIKASVPPLVWMPGKIRGMSAEAYSITAGVEKYSLFFGQEVLLESKQSIEGVAKLKAAANAHHVAQMTDWMMK